MDADVSQSPSPKPVKPAAVIATGRTWATIGIFLLLVVAGLAFARDFLVPVVLAFLLTLVFSPVRRFLERRGVRSAFAALLIVGLLVVTLTAGLLTLAVPVAQWIEDAPTIGRQLENRLRSLRGAAQSVQEATEQVDRITETDNGNVPRVEVAEPGYASTIAGIAPKAAAQLVFVLVLLYFLLASGDMIYEKIVHVSTSFNDKKRAIRIAYDIERMLSRYFFTITTINAGLGVAIGLAMWLIDMPNPLLFGVLAFALNFIPYFGAVMGVALATTVGLVSFPEVGTAFLAGAAYLGLTTLEGQILTPYFVGRRLQLNTVVVFLSVAFWAWLWSAVGMLMATPLLVTIRTFCEHIPSLNGLGDFLSARGAEREDAE